MTFGLHLTRHGGHKVLGWGDVADLHPSNLDAPSAGRLVDDGEKLAVHSFTLRQGLVHLQRTENRSDVGHRQVLDGGLQVIDLIGRFGGIDHPIEDHGVDLDLCIVACDHRLRRNIQNRLHHVDIAPDAVDYRDDEVQTGLQSRPPTTEALDGVLEALRYDLRTQEKQADDQNRGDDDEDEEAVDFHSTSSRLRDGLERSVPA